MNYEGIAGGDQMPALPQAIIVFACAAIIAALLVYAVLLVIRKCDPRLLIMLLCGASAGLLEGFACYLIQCHHAAHGSYVVYQAFGVYTPLWLAEVYVIFFGGAGYALLQALTTKPSAKLFWICFAATGIGEGLFEMYAIHLGMHEYYGQQSLSMLGFPLYLGFVNPTLAAFFTLYSALWFREVKGVARWLLPLLTPALMSGAYAAMVMPTAAGLYAGSEALTQGGALIGSVIALTIAAFSYRGLVKVTR